MTYASSNPPASPNKKPTQLTDLPNDESVQDDEAVKGGGIPGASNREMPTTPRLKSDREIIPCINPS